MQGCTPCQRSAGGAAWHSTTRLGSCTSARGAMRPACARSLATAAHACPGVVLAAQQGHVEWLLRQRCALHGVPPASAAAGCRRGYTGQGALQRMRHPPCAAAAAAADAGGSDPSNDGSAVVGQPSSPSTTPSPTPSPATSRANAAAAAAAAAAAHAAAVVGRSAFQQVLKPIYMSVLLFVVLGSMIGAALLHWAEGTSMRRANPYTFTVVLAQATGVQRGTPLRMVGVPLGSVQSVRTFLDRAEAVVEVNEIHTVIPKDSRVELTQTGMIPVTFIDVIPPVDTNTETLRAEVQRRMEGRQQQQRPPAVAGGEAGKAASSSAGTGAGGSGKALPQLAPPTQVDACHMQGVLVCAGDRVEGDPGGSLDELMHRTLAIMRRGDPAHLPPS